ncbi:hypothetical protein [Ferrovibrio sp.]|uniref:hypothetical protein n=1 Tax=Ferrovibrio sp. TaxID=1917215 RepID=UPI000CB3EA80|nr:hypothetical protein [Ferrovibrio sp.]PJI39453.1 MAG: hypothetical protein CTR53_12880 [Ferrovibrio sp.]
MAIQPGKPSAGGTTAPPRPLAPKAPAPAAAEAEVEQLEPSQLDDATHAEYRLLYDAAARNVLFAKRQQWRVVQYFTLIALALVAIGIATPFASDVARFVAGFLTVVGVGSLGVIVMLQSWQGNEHAKMSYLANDFSNFARSALRRKPRLSGDIHRYLMLLMMLLYIVVLDVVVVRLLLDMTR